jgi:hypothetical protein
MVLRCGGIKDKDHFESEGKLYGLNPFSHCETDCPYKVGTCISRCSGISIAQRPCLKDDYYRENKETKRVSIRNQKEAERIIEEIEELIKKGENLTNKQTYEYEFSKIFLSEIKKRKKDQ